MQHQVMRFGLATAIFSVLGPASLRVVPVRAADITISEKEEISVGQHMAEQAQMMYGHALPDTDPMSIRVRKIGAALAHLSGRRHIPYSYKVLNNNEIMNAFSVAGGPIFITKKLVSMASNDAELAYVLGHETGHIDRKHMVATIETHRKAAQWASALGDTFGGGGDIVRVATYFGYALWSLGYSRNQETEADILGVRWMSQLGYDPHAAIAMLIKFDKSHPGGAPRFFSTHPGAQDREERITALISDEKLMGVAQKHGGPRVWTAGTDWSTAAAHAQAIQFVASTEHTISHQASAVVGRLTH